MSQKSRNVPAKRTRPQSQPRPYAGRPKLTFTQREVERCIRAARARGMPIGKIEVDPHTGKISIIPGTPADNAHNEWDEPNGKATAAVR
jgi:hypothetical protein